MPRTRQRRNKGEGSITKTPNGKYKATITIGVGIDGKQKRKSVTRDTKREVIEAVTLLKATYGLGNTKTIKDKTLQEVCLEFIDTKSTQLSVASLKNQHFTTFTLPRKLTKPVYTRPALSPLDFLRFGL